MLALIGARTRKLTISSGDLPSAQLSTQLSTSNASRVRSTTSISINRTSSAFHATNVSKVNSKKKSAPQTSMYRTPVGKAVSVANISKSAPAALKSPLVSPKTTFYDSITAKKKSHIVNASSYLKSASPPKQTSSSSTAVAVKDASPATTDKPAATTDPSKHGPSTASEVTDHQLYRVMRVPKDKHPSTCKCPRLIFLRFTMREPFHSPDVLDCNSGLRQIATSRKKGPGVMFKKSRKVKNGSITSTRHKTTYSHT